MKILTMLLLQLLLLMMMIIVKNRGQTYQQLFRCFPVSRGLLLAHHEQLKERKKEKKKPKQNKKKQKQKHMQIFTLEANKPEPSSKIFKCCYS